LENHLLPTQQQTNILIFIPVGVAILYLLDGWSTPAAQPRDVGKETQFLNYNEDEIFKNLIHAEEHLRNIEGTEVAVAKGEASCVVKHLASAEGHADEAISHSADLNRVGMTSQGTPEDFKLTRDQIHNLRTRFQSGGLTVTHAITELRDTRRQFESFNPEFDITKCKACKVEEK
jgi:hypothetical protein